MTTGAILKDQGKDLASILLDSRAAGRAEMSRLLAAHPGEIEELDLVRFVVGPFSLRATLHVARWMPGWALTALPRAISFLLRNRNGQVNSASPFARGLSALYMCRGFWDSPDECRRACTMLRRQNQTGEWFRFYWRDKTTPEHREATEDFRAACAGEVVSLTGEKLSGRVLELGCGNGDLFDHLHIEPANYRGVDFSASMLKIFRDRHPELDLIATEASSYLCADEEYDVIFSHGLIQYFDERMLATHIRNAKRMLAPGGKLVLATVPDGSLRLRYLGGVFHGQTVWNPFFLLKLAWQGRLGTRNGLGHWHSHEEIRRLAAEHGFLAEFATSKTYPYFLHAVLTPSTGPGTPKIAERSAS